jgi:hypothetical protein
MFLFSDPSVYNDLNGILFLEGFSMVWREFSHCQQTLIPSLPPPS